MTKRLCERKLRGKKEEISLRKKELPRNRLILSSKTKAEYHEIHRPFDDLAFLLRC